MARRCTVCSHEQRAKIDVALVNGTGLRDIAGHYGLSRSALSRHKDDHVALSLVKAQDAAEVAQADDLLDQIKGLRNKAVKILDRAENEGDLRTALAGIREARSCIELLAELEGELDRRAQVNIVLSPEWLRTRTALVQALSGHPQASHAVAAVLLELEAGA